MHREIQDKFKGNTECPEYKEKMDYIKKMTRSGEWFTDKEFQVSSNVYGFPIIVFSALNKMMFFDSLIAPVGQKNNY